MEKYKSRDNDVGATWVLVGSLRAQDAEEDAMQVEDSQGANQAAGEKTLRQRVLIVNEDNLKGEYSEKMREVVLAGGTWAERCFCQRS